MPFKDQKQRIARNKAWRATRTPEYHKWLYDRRAFRFWKAEKFEEILELIANRETLVPPNKVATIWLYEARKREQEVGIYFDHEENRPTNDRLKGRR